MGTLNASLNARLRERGLGRHDEADRPALIEQLGQVGIQVDPGCAASDETLAALLAQIEADAAADAPGGKFPEKEPAVFSERRRPASPGAGELAEVQRYAERHAAKRNAAQRRA